MRIRRSAPSAAAQPNDSPLPIVQPERARGDVGFGARVGGSDLPSGERRVGRSLGVRRLPGVRQLWPGLTIVCVGVAVSVWVGGVVADAEAERGRARFGEQARDVAEVIERALLGPVEVSESMRALFKAVPAVQFETFERFARVVLERHRVISALEWAPLVRGDNREAFEAEMRAQGVVDFRLMEPSASGDLVGAEKRSVYLPLAYIVPPEGLSPGLDLFSEFSRRQRSEMIRDSGTLTATGRFRLLEDPPNAFVIALYMPIYDAPTEALDTVERRRTHFVGLAISILRLSSLVDRVVNDDQRLSTFSVRLLDVSNPDPASQLLYERAQPTPGGDGAQVTHTTQITFAGRRWELELTGQAPTQDGGFESSWWVRVSGLALSLLLGGIATTGGVIVQLRAQVEAANTLGQYKLIRELGRGGIGRVYLATHAMLRRPTAVKVLRPESLDPQTIMRFEREVTLTSQLSHPNIVAIYDFGTTKGGGFYYAMELVQGLSLEDLVAKHGPQPQARVVHILKQALAALGEAHAAGLIHRDIKPANLMLACQNRTADTLKVLDFGLVKDTLASPDLSITLNTQMIGTPYYLAPEAIQSNQPLDHRCDLYALGAVAYFLLVGRVVFDALDVMQVSLKHLHAPPIPPSHRTQNPISPALEAMILACLSKAPADRPASAEALLDQLSTLTDVPLWTALDARRWWETHPLPPDPPGPP